MGNRIGDEPTDAEVLVPVKRFTLPSSGNKPHGTSPQRDRHSQEESVAEVEKMDCEEQNSDAAMIDVVQLDPSSGRLLNSATALPGLSIGR